MSKSSPTLIHPTLLACSIQVALFGLGSLPFFAQANDTPKNTAEPLAQDDGLSRLSQFYERHTSGGRCHGVWTYPNQSLAKEQPNNEATVANTAQPTHAPENLEQTSPNNQQDSQQTDHPDNTNAAMHAKADYGYYNNHDYAELSGNVVMHQNNQTLHADKVIYNPITEEAKATGNVTFEQNGQQIVAEQVDFNGKTGQSSAAGNVVFGEVTDPSNPSDKPSSGLMGVAANVTHDGAAGIKAEDVAFASSTINAHGYAQTLHQPNDHQYLLENVMFSTCPPDDRKWQLDASDITLDTDTGRGVAKNSTLRIKNIPIFYLPYFNFPIDDRRSSGFLTPNAGFNSKDGLEVSAPYYLNLAPNYDATLTPTIYTNRNPRLEAEFRYLTRHFGYGKIDAAFLPSDKRYHDEDRSHVFYDHLWQSKSIPNLNVSATYHYVSDNEYLSDFDSLGLTNNALNLSRRVQANYFNDFVHAELKAESFQKLDGTLSDGTPITDKDRPYYRLPQFHADYRLPKFNDNHWLDQVDVTGVTNIAYFKKPITDNSDTEKSGVRAFNQLSISYPMMRSWGYITPKVTLSHLYTSFDEDSLNALSLSREQGSYSIFVPQISLDTGLHFEKSGTPFGRFNTLGGYQVLSPRLKYLYSPYKNQDNIPVFETSLASISYDQLLSDTWFLGYDRLQDLHALTPALNYRWVDSQGLTRLDASIAEQFYLNDVRVGLGNHTFANNSSGMAWQASAQPRENLWFDTQGSLTSDHKLNAILVQGRYQPKPDMLFNLGVIERKQNDELQQLNLSAITAAAIFPVNQNWRIIAQGQYDYDHDKIMDSLLGVNYEDCCIGVSVYARHYRNDLNPQEPANNAIMAELRLSGISRGGRLARALSQKVIGYGDTQNAWEQGY